MAEKRLDRVEIVIQKDLEIGEVKGVINAQCFSPDLEVGFVVSLPLAGVEEIMTNSIDALKTHMEDGGKHSVIESAPKEEE
tara:strand:- start:1652 stop:1894 length:243 start_codon:yes stop_codon:yes gene_type:complete